MDNMLIDAVISLIDRWRIGLAFILSTSISVAMAAWLTWFNGAFGLALIAISLGCGFLWDGQAKPNKKIAGSSELNR